MEHPVAEGLRLCLCKLTVKTGHLHPGEEGAGDECEDEPGVVADEGLDGRLRIPQSFQLLDTVLDTGVPAVAELEGGDVASLVCPACSEVYKGGARHIIRAGLTGGKGIPESVATHPCVFATLTALGFGPVHTIRPGRRSRRSGR